MPKGGVTFFFYTSSLPLSIPISLSSFSDKNPHRRFKLRSSQFSRVPPCFVSSPPHFLLSPSANHRRAHLSLAITTTSCRRIPTDVSLPIPILSPPRIRAAPPLNLLCAFVFVVQSSVAFLDLGFGTPLGLRLLLHTVFIPSSRNHGS